MLRVKIEKNITLDQGLKILKSKVNRTRLVKEIRERQQFEKPSVKKRKTKLKAVYRQKFRNDQ